MSKRSTPCSADLIRLLVSGAAVPTVTLTQTASDGVRPYNLVTVTMTDVLVASYTINGGSSPTVCYSLATNVVSS